LWKGNILRDVGVSLVPRSQTSINIIIYVKFIILTAPLCEHKKLPVTWKAIDPSGVPNGDRWELSPAGPELSGMVRGSKIGRIPFLHIFVAVVSELKHDHNAGSSQNRMHQIIQKS